jgi:hypothetical protein
MSQWINSIVALSYQRRRCLLWSDGGKMVTKLIYGVVERSHS